MLDKTYRVRRLYIVILNFDKLTTDYYKNLLEIFL